jgi:hypothetical protein
MGTSVNELVVSQNSERGTAIGIDLGRVTQVMWLTNIDAFSIRITWMVANGFQSSRYTCRLNAAGSDHSADFERRHDPFVEDNRRRFCTQSDAVVVVVGSPPMRASVIVKGARSVGASVDKLVCGNADETGTTITTNLRWVA